METLAQTYKRKISNTLSCYDRIIFQGIMPEISYAQGMTSFMFKNNEKIFDYPRYVEPLKDLIRKNAEQIAKEHGIEIEFIRKKHIRKEDLIKKKLSKRGYHNGIVHIISALEQFPTYQPWHDKQSGKTFLRPSQSKCIHYYFYFIDEHLGYGYVRVPTWSPFRLQVYINGHDVLSRQLSILGIDHTMIDNAFDSIADIACSGISKRSSDKTNPPQAG